MKSGKDEFPPRPTSFRKQYPIKRNPEGCQMVAGGRSAVQTSGKVSGNSSHLGRGARNLPPCAGVEWGLGWQRYVFSALKSQRDFASKPSIGVHQRNLSFDNQIEDPVRKMESER